MMTTNNQQESREAVARRLCDDAEARQIAEQLDAPCFDDSSPHVQRYWLALARLTSDTERASPGAAEVGESAMPSGVRAERSMDALQLWFFRDLSDDQRSKLFALWLGKEAAQEANSHIIQRRLLHRLVRTAYAPPALPAPEQPAQASEVEAKVVELCVLAEKASTFHFNRAAIKIDDPDDLFADLAIVSAETRAALATHPSTGERA